MRSLRARMTVFFTLATTGLMLLVSLGVLAYLLHSANRNAERVLAAGVRRVQAELAEDGGLKSAAELVREENELLEHLDGAIFVLGPEGRIVAQSRRHLPRWPGAEQDGWRVAVIRAREHTIVVGLPWGKTLAGLRREAAIMGGLVLCVALFTAIGAWVVVGRTLSPIRKLARQAGAASTSSLQVHLKAPSEDAELVELVGTLNRLLQSLTQTTEARGRFYAAASHELRTPLQALSGHLELALTRPRRTDEYRSALEEAHGQARRLTRLVRELLLLNQLHQRTAAPPADPVDLAESVERLLVQLRTVFDENRLAVQCELPQRAETQGPPGHVDIVLRNLIENAGKYGVPGSDVVLSLAPGDDGWRFEIWNECSPAVVLQPEEAFEPFFRPDASRSSHTGGNGLGLAICKAIVDANGWTLDWSREPGGVRARVGFPAAGPQPAEESVSCPAPVMASR